MIREKRETDTRVIPPDHFRILDCRFFLKNLISLHLHFYYEYFQAYCRVHSGSKACKC